MSDFSGSSIRQPTPATTEYETAIEAQPGTMIALANVVIRNLRLIVAIPAALVLLVAIPTLLADREYTSQAAFMPQQAEIGGSLAGLASQFGLGGASASPGQSPAFYSEFLSSHTLLNAVVSETYTFEEAGRQIRGTYAELQDVDDPGTPRGRELAIRDLRERMSASHSRETGIVRLGVRMENPQFSKALADRMLQLVNEFNLNTRQTQAAAERRFVEGRLAEVKDELRAAEQRLMQFLQQNRQFRSAELQAESERLENEVGMRRQVVTSLTESYEKARIDEVRNTPVITVVQQPTLPALPDRRGLVRKTFVTGLMGLLLGLFIAFVLEAVRRERLKSSADYTAFYSAARAAFRDLLRPWRGLRRRKPDRTVV